MGALVTTAHAYLARGDGTPDSEREAVAADTLIRSIGNLIAVERCRTLLARLYVLQGRLRQAAATYEQVQQALPGPERHQTLFGSFFYHFALGDLLRPPVRSPASHLHPPHSPTAPPQLPSY